jgi:transcriptional regulator with XRE-family HTH domain
MTNDTPRGTLSPTIAAAARATAARATAGAARAAAADAMAAAADLAAGAVKNLTAAAAANVADGARQDMAAAAAADLIAAAAALTTPDRVAAAVADLAGGALQDMQAAARARLIANAADLTTPDVVGALIRQARVQSLKAWREECGLSQRRLAERAAALSGIATLNDVTVANIEHARTRPTLDTALAFASALGVLVEQVRWPTVEEASANTSSRRTRHAREKATATT